MANSTYVYGNFACKTDIGKVRMTNEDRAGAFTNAKGNILLIVCDGMGGQSCAHIVILSVLCCFFINLTIGFSNDTIKPVSSAKGIEEFLFS